MTTTLPKFFEVYAASIGTIGLEKDQPLTVNTYELYELNSSVNVIVHPQHGVLFNNDLRGQLLNRNGQGQWDFKIGRSMWFQFSKWENELIENQFYTRRNENEQKVSDRNLKIIEFLQSLAQ